MNRSTLLPDAALRRMLNGLVVSCQAPPGSPLRSPHIMAAMAQAADQGGATGIRANGPADVEAIQQSVSIPVLGLHKVVYPDSPVYITPTTNEIDQLLEADCRLIALDATDRQRPGGAELRDLVQHIHRAGALAFGDIATADDISVAIEAGVDAIGSTLSGYTGDAPPPSGPDFDLVREMASRVSIPIYAEGRYSTPEQVATARELGASLVVVGTAITNVTAITRTMAAPFTTSSPSDETT